MREIWAIGPLNSFHLTRRGGHNGHPSNPRAGVSRPNFTFSGFKGQSIRQGNLVAGRSQNESGCFVGYVLVDIARDTNEVIRITIKAMPSEKMFMMSDPVP